MLVSLTIRVPRLNQSLWYDEMYTLTDYVDAPWSRIVAARPGEYVPNDHVLHSLLAKACYAMGPQGERVGLGPSEGLLRLPATLAGTLLPIALTWPLRRAAPVPALLLALLAGVHPWLIAFSTEARGYTLMLLLGVLATHALPPPGKRVPWKYALLLAGAIYTIPIALLLLPAHAALLIVLHRDRLAAWSRGAGLALLIAFLLYFPLLPAMRMYYRHPYEPTVSYAQLIDQLPRFALAGERLPHTSPGEPANAIVNQLAWALPVVLLAIGTPLVWKFAPLRPMLLLLVFATVIGVLLPIAVSGATEVRFVPWIALWLCTAVAGLILSLPTRPHQLAAFGVAAALLIVQDVRMLPHQPVRDALEQADRLAPPGDDLMVAYLGGAEAAFLYGPQQSHRVLLGPDAPRWFAAEETARRETGRDPWIVILYEDLLLRRLNEPQTRGLWLHLQRDYDCVARLPGRISPVAIYRPHPSAEPVAVR